MQSCVFAPKTEVQTSSLHRPHQSSLGDQSAAWTQHKVLITRLAMNAGNDIPQESSLSELDEPMITFQVGFQIRLACSQRTTNKLYLFLQNSRIVSIPKFQMASGNKHMVYKKIQGGQKHDITLRLSTKCPWENARLTLHRWGHPHQLLPFNLENVWIEDGDNKRTWVHSRSGFAVYSDSGSRSYTSVRAQFCKEYFDEKIQFSMHVNGKCSSTNVAIVVVKNSKRKNNPDGTCRNCNPLEFKF